VAGLLGVENMRMVRYEADATVTVVAEWGEPDAAFPVGSRLPNTLTGGRGGWASTLVVASVVAVFITVASLAVRGGYYQLS
jgi:hypothetical protein